MVAPSPSRAAPSTLRAAILSCCAGLGPVAAVADDAAPTASTDTREAAVHFAFDEDEMMREGEIKVAWLVASAGGRMDRVEIEGHADSTGPEGYNVDLSLRRARAVRDFLVDELGIDRSTLSVVAYGEAYPAASNATPDGRAANRRVEFRRITEASADAGS